MSWIQTFTGKAFDVLRPSSDDVCIEDIAHALAHTCRYGGHSRSFYSVAEHCVWMSYTVDTDNALWALLHDASEAYVGDMMHPLKVNIPAFSLVEDRVMAAICERYDLFPFMPQQVREHDLRICVDEAAALLGPPPKPWEALEGVPRLGIDVLCWEPAWAEHQYLHRFNQLTEHKENRNG